MSTRLPVSIPITIPNEGEVCLRPRDGETLRGGRGSGIFMVRGAEKVVLIVHQRHVAALRAQLLSLADELTPQKVDALPELEFDDDE